MERLVATVQGNKRADQLGVTLMHEHLVANLMRITLNPDHILNDIELAVVELKRFREQGGETLVEVTSRGLGRNPEALKRIAAESGVNIVMGCGWYREHTYTPEVFVTSTSQLAAQIIEARNQSG